MLTDALYRAGLETAKFSADVQASIDPLLPPFLGRNNPLDLGGSPFHYLDRLQKILEILDANPDSDFSILAVGSFERRQFEIADERSPEEIAVLIRRLGYEPVWKDWDKSLDGIL